MLCPAVRVAGGTDIRAPMGSDLLLVVVAATALCFDFTKEVCLISVRV
jgi:hypothetical protein